MHEAQFGDGMVRNRLQEIHAGHADHIASGSGEPGLAGRPAAQRTQMVAERSTDADGDFAETGNGMEADRRGGLAIESEPAAGTDALESGYASALDIDGASDDQ